MKKLSLLLPAVILLLALSGCDNCDPVADMKAAVFDGVTVTFEEIVDTVTHDAQWSKEKLSDDHYTVTVTGTIEDDIPDFRRRSGENFCAVLTVQYYNDQYQAEVTDGYWGSSDGVYDSVSYLLAAYKVAAGITPEELFMDANKETRNESLPLYTIQQERRAVRRYELVQESDNDVYDHQSNCYYWLDEIVDAPNCVGYTLNSISLERFGSVFSVLDYSDRETVLALFNSGTTELSQPSPDAAPAPEPTAAQQFTLDDVFDDPALAEAVSDVSGYTLAELARWMYDADFFSLPRFAQELVLNTYHSGFSDPDFIYYHPNDAGYSLEDIANVAYGLAFSECDSSIDWKIINFYLSNRTDFDGVDLITEHY